MAKKPAEAGTSRSKAGPPSKGVAVRSAEGSRMTGMRRIPTSKRDAAIAAFLRSAK